MESLNDAVTRAVEAGCSLGELALRLQAEQLADMIRSVKADTATLELQRRFFDEAQAPRSTPQK